MNCLTESTCPVCGAVIPSSSPGGQCVRCLLDLALKAAEAPQSAEPEVRTSPVKRFGDYELIQELGRGGMGLVWKAHQIKLNREVALKLVLEGQFANETAIKRFQFEAEAIAGLDHPNIVPIYEVGQYEGWPYFSTKLIEGRDLGQRLRDFSVPVAVTQAGGHCTGSSSDQSGSMFPKSGLREQQRRIAALVSKVARAVHHAHQRGILHRDLKPSNILIDSNGEPHVTDFGLAKRFTADGRLTATEALLGSPFYMAPEQAVGKSSQLTTAADTYSLGVILYELLTSQLPFKAESPIATLKLVLDTEPPRLRSINPALDRDLETICLRCLAKEPAKRYESTGALADDLDRWQRGEPILARRVGPVECSWKWVRRHPLKAALVGVTCLALGGPLLTGVYLMDVVFPREARSHPMYGLDHNLNAFLLPFETKHADRATMNFDMYVFEKGFQTATFWFTNIPPEHAEWAATLRCQIFADIPGAPDEPRSPVVRQGDVFKISQIHRLDRAYYVAPIGGWIGEDVLTRAPDARLCILLIDNQRL